MAMELMMDYINTNRLTNTENIDSVDKLIKLLSQTHESQQLQHQHQNQSNLSSSSPKLNNVISLLGRTRTGHARFRRSPLASTTQNQKPNKDYVDTNVYCPTPIQQVPPNLNCDNETKELVTSAINISFSPEMSRANSFNISTLTGETETKPPLSSSNNALYGKCTSHCHSSKKRKQMKRVIRVPAISVKLNEIPPDDYSWRKYGQKPIKGSPYPRGYYKCSSVKGCPARKHVERALDDPAMLIVTYEAEHNHSLSVAETNSNLILESS